MNESTKNFFRENGLQITLQVVGVVVLLLNLWLASKLSPLAQDITSVNVRVSALEERIPASNQDHTDIQVIKEQVLNIRQTAEDIRSDVKFLIGNTR